MGDGSRGGRREDRGWTSGPLALGLLTSPLPPTASELVVSEGMEEPQRRADVETWIHSQQVS